MDEIRAGKVDKTRSYIQFIEAEDRTEYDWKLSVVVNQSPVMDVSAYRDQWGTYLSFSIDGKGFTIAQEDETKSFVDALIAGLSKMRQITDIKTKQPTLIEYQSLPTE